MFHLKKPGKKNSKLTLYHYHLKVGGGEGGEGRGEKGKGVVVQVDGRRWDEWFVIPSIIIP